MDVSGAPEAAPQPASHSREKGKLSEVKSGSKPQTGAAAKAKKTASPKRKTGPAVQPAYSKKAKARAEAIASEISSSIPESLEKRIGEFFGLRYRMGGQGRDGIDCSGLVQKVYSDVFGIELPRNTSEQSRLRSLESVTEEELKPGDLLFFGPKRKKVNHVGMYLASGYFLHASRSQGVTISRVDERYWKSRWIFSKRVKGLETEYDSDQESELERTLEQDSAGFAFSEGPSYDTAGFVEAGIRINDSLEFLLSGFSMYRFEKEAPFQNLHSSAYLQEAQIDETGGGFRLAAVLSPSDWFRVVPSVSRIEGVEEGKIPNGSRQQLGLETRMILPSSRIAVFMAAHADTLQDLERQLDFSPDWQSLDVMLGLHYRFSDAFGFSLWGTRGSSQDLKENQDSGRRSLPLDDVSFQLNVKF
jgi:cell wall-associated NlpC family hydrolase